MPTISTNPHSQVALAIIVILGIAGCGGGRDESNPQESALSLQQSCERLHGKTVGAATITEATMIDAKDNLPAHCKVSAAISPSLSIELLLPGNWNGKMVYSGGGGYDGSITSLQYFYSGPGILRAGYAIAQSNGGHDGSPLDASFASNPYLAYLFGSGSVPTAATTAKEMLQVAFGKAPERSYFEGCSNGGREGLMAAQRNPDLFDGIIARAPAYNWTGTMGAFNRTAKALAAPGGAFSEAKIALLAKGMREACDANDGIVDGVVSNRSSCNFDRSALRCPSGADAGDSCLSDAQLAVVSSWTTIANFGNGAYASPGWPLSGNEDDPQAWAIWVSGATGNGSTGLQYFFQDTTVKNYLARDANANSLTYDFDSNQGALLGLASLNDATNTDLRPFMNAGAKLILWHGTNDSALSNRATTIYYEGLKTAMGGQATLDKFVRYYQAPGVNHCFGGPGADSVDLVTVLDNWVTQGSEPGQPIASKRNTDGSTAFTRPLCQYPQYPRYIGPANDANAAKLAANYRCMAP